MPEDSGDVAIVTALAFDYGLRAIGCAVGQTLSASASPVSVLKARDGQPDWQAVEEVISQWQPDLLLVGLPLNMDGSESEFCLRARKFARRLQGRFGLPVKMVDERLSSREAKGRSGRHGKDAHNYRKHPVDDLAAQIILETWLGNPDYALSP